MSQDKVTPTETDDRAFEMWFQNYLLHKTASCLDRDILRWAKPILKVGYLEQDNLNKYSFDSELEYKGSGKYLLLEEENKKLHKIAELGNCLAEQCLAWAKDRDIPVTTEIEKEIISLYKEIPTKKK